MHPEQPRAGSGSNVVAVLVGAFIGAVFAFGVSGIGGLLLLQKQRHDLRRGWNLVPVVVASRDLPEGTELTYDVIAQRAVPEQFVTSSVLTPGQAQDLVNHRLLVPLQAGDPVRWSDVETENPSGSTFAACAVLWSRALEKEKVSELKSRLEATARELELNAPQTVPAKGKPLGDFPNVE